MTHIFNVYIYTLKFKMTTLQKDRFYAFKANTIIIKANRLF